MTDVELGDPAQHQPTMQYAFLLLPICCLVICDIALDLAPVPIISVTESTK